MPLNIRDREGIALFREMLDEAEYASFYKGIRDYLFDKDPWFLFDVKVGQFSATIKQELLERLFLRGETVSRYQFINKFSQMHIDALLRIGILSDHQGTLISPFVVLHSFHNYIVIETPITYYGNKKRSSATYLDAVSFDMAKWLASERPVGKFLELGCGSGLLLLVASISAERSVGTDLDQQAALITKFNLMLNNRDQKTDIVVSDLFGAIIPNNLFHTILFHPPYRIVPPSVNYPNPLARMGTGKDGLDHIRRYLSEVDSYLDSNGRALFACEFPSTSNGIQFLDELNTFAKIFQWKIHILETGSTAFDEQSMITTEKCINLNPQYSFSELYQIIHNYYRELNIAYLRYCRVYITKSDSAEVYFEGLDA